MLKSYQEQFAAWARKNIVIGGSEDAAVGVDAPQLAAGGGNDAQAAEDVLNAMRELQALLEPSSSNPGNELTDETSGAAVEATWESELSDELRALSSDEATDMASRFLAPAEREANGRTAFWLLSKAAAEGNGRAMYLLFVCHSKGIGVTADQSKSLQWLASAAEAGDAAGMLAYSRAIRRGMYDGLGESEAQMWLNRSASVGNPAAVNELKRQQAMGAVAALGALAAAVETNDEPSQSSLACNAQMFLGGPCSCDGFTPLLNGDRFDMTRCGDCLHDKASHNIE